MTLRKRLYFTVGVMSFALIAVPDTRDRAATAVSAAKAVLCPPNLQGQTVASVSVKGGTCEISDTSVQGDIEVKDGTVSIRNSHIGGNIKSKGVAVQLSGGVTVEGDLRITQAQEDSGFLGDDNTIKGVVEYKGNAGYLIAHYGTIGGNMHVGNNTGGVSIIGNIVAGNLVCQDNDPPPTGFDNQVSGNRKGQCADTLKGKVAAGTQVRRAKLRRDKPDR
jgi:hypothetical protein